jgi:hypothetical protein
MADDLIDQVLRVDALVVDRLLADWCWLCPEPVSLVARNTFGDLFLVSAEGRVLWLQVATGELAEVAASQSQFLDLLNQNKGREAWLAETDAKAAAERGLLPSAAQCVGFKVPLVFSQSGEVADNAYVADLYEQVSFLGDLHRQISGFPDGASIQLRVKR